MECPQVDLVALVWEQLEKKAAEIPNEERLREQLDAIVEQLRQGDTTSSDAPAARCEVIAPEAFEKEGFKENLIEYLVEELRKAGKLGFLNKN